MVTEESKMADGSITLGGIAEYETNYGVNEVLVEWDAIIKNEKIVSLECRVVKGWEPYPETVVNAIIYEWVKSQRRGMNETAHYQAIA